MSEPLSFVLKHGDRELHVSKIRTANGHRLRLYSPQLDAAIDLDPLELESLTWQREQDLMALPLKKTVQKEDTHGNT